MQIEIGKEPRIKVIVRKAFTAGLESDFQDRRAFYARKSAVRNA